MTKPTGPIVIGTVTITRTSNGWSASCARCPWTQRAGEFGLLSIKRTAGDHRCGDHR